MKYLSLFIIGLLFIGSTFAQMPAGGASVTGRINGLIIDSLTQKPVDYATVGLGRTGSTKTTNGSLSDEKGSFKIDNIAPGAYRLTISFLGYQTKVIDPIKTTPQKPDLNLGRIILSPNANALNEVVIEGQAAVVENKIDRVVYNAERDVTVGGGNASDVLRKVPLLSVDMDGNVSLRGSQNVRVLINGKPSGSMANNIADALKMIPADQIKNVEVITSPSAKYDAEGTSGIINIITKKRNAEGVSGTIGGGLGLRQNNGNANLNIKKGRLGITANMGGNGSWPQISEVSLDRTDANGNPTFTQKSSSEFYRLGYRGSTGVDYDINSFNTINSTFNFNRFQNSFEGEVFSTIYSGGNTFAANSNTDRLMKMKGFDWNTDYTHKFKKAGQEISFAGQLTENKNIQDYTTLYSGGYLPNEKGNNDATNQEVTFQTDYVNPFKKVTLETGAKLILRDISSPTLVKQEDNNGDYVLNPTLSNTYNYNQDVYAAYATLAFPLSKKYQVKLGGRMEVTRIQGDAQGSNDFSNNYQNFIPSVVISRSLKNYQTIKLSYNQRIQRPSLFYLNPFRNTADPVNQSEGNPGLSPELSHNFELAYSTFIKTTVINASVYYRLTQDVIESVVTSEVDANNNPISLTTFKNIGRNSSVGMNLFGSINPVPKVTLRGNLNTYTYDIATSSPNSGLTSGSDKTYFMYNAFLSASLNLKGGFTAETFLILNSPRRTAQGTNPSFRLWNMGFKKEILKKKGSIGINIIDPFNERKNFNSSINTANFKQTSNFSIPFRSVGINFSWQFGKMNFAQGQPKKKRGVNNDDLKQGDQGVQQ
ncbi:MAG: TonB-dependent receptor domain-containing protein [Sphingobacteriaceae bacterium]